MSIAKKIACLAIISVFFVPTLFMSTNVFAKTYNDFDRCACHHKNSDGCNSTCNFAYFNYFMGNKFHDFNDFEQTMEHHKFKNFNDFNQYIGNRYSNFYQLNLVFGLKFKDFNDFRKTMKNHQFDHFDDFRQYMHIVCQTGG